MTRRISLALALHNHQPVGNFGWVFAEVYERAYLPMLDALERHPGIRVALHYTGPLLEWLRAERPEFVARLRALVDRDQVEILGGGLYEPVLASLPERDRIGQLTRMASEIEEAFGRRPQGAWLAERVWEPDIPTSLGDSGYRWTILDDAHFRAAAIPEDAMWGPYTTDDQGRLITVFGTEQGLRYRIPFQDVEDVIAYLRDHATEAGDRVGTMGDDGEKFGAWPTTWEHCWGEGRWVERFFEALEANADWLTTTTPSAWLASNAPVGRVYVPTGSYAEMGEWALPPDESRAFSDALHRARDEHRPEARWLRGAFWRNFQVKYREINDLHKQMLRASAKVAGMSEGPDRTSALDHLYRGQSNDCYWHGLFGGIYISHMRAATAEHLIAAEEAADAEADRLDDAAVADFDLDGRDEVLLANAGQVVLIDLDEGGGIGEWDLRAPRHALTSVLRRRPEAYHETLRREAAVRQQQADAASASGDGSVMPASADSAGAPASIHDIVRMKEPDLADRLLYDAYERRSGLVRFLPSATTQDDWRGGGGADLGDFVAGRFRLDRLDEASAHVVRDGTVRTADATHAVRVAKTVAIGGSRRAPVLDLTIEVENRSDSLLEARLGIEWATTMLGGGGNPSAWWELGSERSRHDGSGGATRVAAVGQGNDWLGAAVEATVDPVGDAWWAPIETVSNSEDGFERVYQGSALLLSWPVRIPAGGSFTAAIRQSATITRDRADEELSVPSPGV